MSNSENVCPQAARGLLRELQRLAAHPPAGIKVLLRDDISDVHAIIEGPADTPYEGGVFHVRLAVGRDFPAAPPRAFFVTRVFHPNVSVGGEVCVNTLRRDWKPELGLEHALLALKCLLIAPNPDSALNAEAAALLRDRYADYCARARLYTDIHARPDPTHKKESACAADEVGPCAKRERRPAPSAPAAASGPAKDKRRILKRL